MKGGEEKMNKKIKALIIVLTMVAGLGLWGVETVKANEEVNYPPVIQKLVEKFNLDENEVKSVFDQDREEHRTQRQTRFSEKLDQAVSDGKITAEQKDLIVKKHEEIQTENESLRDLSPEERRERMQEKRTAWESWAQENGIELADFFGFSGPKGEMGRGMGMGFHKDF